MIKHNCFMCYVFVDASIVIDYWAFMYHVLVVHHVEQFHVWEFEAESQSIQFTELCWFWCFLKYEINDPIMITSDQFWSILINSDQFWSNHCFDQNRSELIRIDQNWSEFNICLKHVYSTLLSVIHHLIDVSSVMNCSTCVQFLSAFTVKLDMLMALAKGMCTSSIVFHTIQID